MPSGVLDFHDSSELDDLGDWPILRQTLPDGDAASRCWGPGVIT